MSVSIVRGVTEDGQIVTLKLNDDGTLALQQQTGGGSGGGDFTADIAQSIGAIDSPTAYELSEPEGANFNWNLVSLLRGVLTYLRQSFSKISDIYDRLYTFSLRHSTSIELQNFSEVITAANTSSTYQSSIYQRKYLFIQNLPIAPMGNLWINFGAPALAGAGSILLAPGESFSIEGSAIPNGEINLLGTTAGMQFTYKEG